MPALRSGARTLAVAGACATAFALSGCGGSDDGDGGTLTAAEFRSQADALCVAADAEVEEIARDVAGSVTEDVGVTMIRAMMDRMRVLVEDLAALEPPASLSGTFEELLDEARAGLTKVDEAEYTEFESMPNPFASAGSRADELGLDDCVKLLG